MPRKPQKIVKKGGHDWQVEFLLTGKVLKADGSPSLKALLWLPEIEGCFSANYAETWGQVREELLAGWIAAHPCSRPWAFWEQDITEPRLPDETELEYLQRHSLLTPGEQACLKKQAGGGA